MQRFRASLSELNPEGLVDVLRALSTANALPSHQWLTDFEADLQRRYAMSPGWPVSHRMMDIMDIMSIMTQHDVASTT
jgi:hypothetical protein